MRRAPLLAALAALVAPAAPSAELLVPELAPLEAWVAAGPRVAGCLGCAAPAPAGALGALGGGGAARCELPELARNASFAALWRAVSACPNPAYRLREIAPEHVSWTQAANARGHSSARRALPSRPRQRRT